MVANMSKPNQNHLVLEEILNHRVTYISDGPELKEHENLDEILKYE